MVYLGEASDPACVLRNRLLDREGDGRPGALTRYSPCARFCEPSKGDGFVRRVRRDFETIMMCDPLVVGRS